MVVPSDMKLVLLRCILCPADGGSAEFVFVRIPGKIVSLSMTELPGKGLPHRPEVLIFFYILIRIFPGVRFVSGRKLKDSKCYSECFLRDFLFWLAAEHLHDTHRGHTRADLRAARRACCVEGEKINVCNVIKVIVALTMRNNAIQIYIGHAWQRRARGINTSHAVIG